MIRFYATLSSGDTRPQWMDSSLSYLCAASSWYRHGMKKPRLPYPCHVAADCGGFRASLIWGDYRYTPEQYVTWCNTFNPAWAATMDWCCENEITSGNTGVVRERQQRTTEAAYQFYRDYRAVDWTWCCTIQGWTVEDYRYHARQMKPLLIDWRRHYGDNSMWRVGIGTLCHRADDDMIRAVIVTVLEELPNVPIHLWGVKLSVLKSVVELRNVVSVDSSAWTSLTTKGKGYKTMGISKAKHYYSVALPAYIQKVDYAIRAPKQRIML